MHTFPIQVTHLSKHFGKIEAVKDLNFTVQAGSMTALLGGNGAGKTTTLAMMLGLLLPSNGSIQLLGEDILHHRYRILPRINFSSPYVDLPLRLTVTENLTVYAHLYGLRNVPQRLKHLGADLDITEFMQRPYGTLSAGQRTRVALAKAFLNEPELLLLDEPTASLDPDTADRIRSYLDTYRTRTGATILLASHNMYEVERLCDHVLILKMGHLVDQGSPNDLLHRYGRQTLEQVFLDIARQPTSNHTTL
jgi:ABC-2 type transport system ATP-binding protein